MRFSAMSPPRIRPPATSSQTSPNERAVQNDDHDAQSPTMRTSHGSTSSRKHLDTIRDGKKAAKAQWQLVVKVFVGSGLAVLLPMTWLMVLCWWGVLPEAWGSSFWYGAILTPAFYWMVMAVKPQSARMIYWVAMILRVYWLSLMSCFLVYIAFLANLAAGVPEAKTALQICMLDWGLLSVYLTAGAIGVQPVLRKREPLRGSRALACMWFCMRAVIGCVGATTIVCYAIAGYAVDPGFVVTRDELAQLDGSTTWFDGAHAIRMIRADDTQAAVFAGCVYIACMLAFTAGNRRRIHELLSRISNRSTGRAAAMVAGMIGGKSVDEVYEMGRDIFFGLPFAALTETDLERSSERLLGPLVKKVPLGECHAFISHSWSDSGVRKYRALERWASALTQPEVLIWLDRACIDQGNIDASLACLPIFLSGCKQMVILAGETYVSRLWCVVEVFVFIQMGASFNRLSVHPIADDAAGEKERLFAQFGSFRCEAAQCFKPEDKDRLLSIIEAGFGGFHDFDHLVREVLLKRLKGDAGAKTEGFRKSLKKAAAIAMIATPTASSTPTTAVLQVDDTPTEEEVLAFETP